MASLTHPHPQHAQANRTASQLDFSQINSTADPLVKAKLVKRQQKHKSIIVHYTHEKRFAHYKSKIHQQWNASFPICTGIETKLIVGTSNHPNINKELVRRISRLKNDKHNNNFTKHTQRQQIP